MRLAEFLFVSQPYRTPDGHDNKTGPADDSGGTRAQKGIINAACHKISGGGCKCVQSTMANRCGQGASCPDRQIA